MKKTYLRLLKDAFPGAIIEYVENFDDSHEGFEIIPNTYLFLRFMYQFDSPLHIKIIGYKLNPWSQDMKKHIIFSGSIPGYEKAYNILQEEDLVFIEKILTNINKFLCN